MTRELEGIDTERGRLAAAGGRDRSEEPERVVVVGLLRSGERREDLDDTLSELEELVRTLGGTTVGRIVQTRNRLHPATLIGSGKVSELAELVRQRRVDWIAFDHDLTPAQGKNLEDRTGVPVVDRRGVILNIFSRHAKTAVAKMQVELAQLEYLAPRLKQQWTHLSRQQGGIGVRGVGEKQIELDRRAIRKRMALLRRKLARVDIQRQVQRSERLDVFKVALVGYTNSGKSTLLNRLTSSEVLVENKLFSTLEAKVAGFAPPFKPTVLLSDTVGFIRKLPHSLVASFKSTLDEAVLSDLLLHVVDLSDRRFRKHIEVGRGVLDELGLGSRPRILVFNKIDVVEGKLPAIVTAMHRRAVAVSARTGQGMEELKDEIASFFDSRLHSKTIEIDYNHGDLLSRIYETSKVDDVEYLDGKVRVELKATSAEIARIERLIDGTGTGHEER